MVKEQHVTESSKIKVLCSVSFPAVSTQETSFGGKEKASSSFNSQHTRNKLLTFDLQTH